MALQLSGSVGRQGKNRRADVATVQLVLSLDPARVGPRIPVDGAVGDAMISAIESFQQKAATATPDGRVDPHGSTWRLMQGASAAAIAARSWLPAACAPRLSDLDFAAAAARLRCELAAIKAVAEVESRGDGFFPSGRPKILFEAHIFSARTKAKHDAVFPDISSPAWNPALYAYGEREYDRLEKAMILDRDAALKSASWGRFQVMGFNHEIAGYPSVQQFVSAMCASERAHLDAFVSFVIGNGLDVAIRSKDWTRFAKGYNGPQYAKNQYDEKIKAAYVTHSKAVARR